jgi:DoxX-like family
MLAAYVAATAITIVLNAAAVFADLTHAKWMLAGFTQIGVPHSLLPLLATLKAAGAAGLLAGLLGIRPLGVAAAAGLVLFFIGAVAFHLRARAFSTLPPTLGYLAFAVTSLALTVVSARG